MVRSVEEDKNNDTKLPRFGFSNIFNLIFFKEFFIFFFIFLFFAYMATPHYPKAGSKRFRDNCFRQLRFITDTIEMYNLDNEQKISILNEENIKILLEKKYLKENHITQYTPLCKYHSEGDLASDSGVIFCDAHGDLDGNITPKYTESEVNNEIYKLQRKYKFQAHLYTVLMCFFAAFIFVWISKLLFPNLLTFFKIIVGLLFLYIYLLLAWLMLSNFVNYSFK